MAPTPKGSANTGSDGGTDYGEDEDVEVAASPGTRSFHVLSAFMLSIHSTITSTAIRKASARSWQRRKGKRAAWGARERYRVGSWNKEAETGRVEYSVAP